MNTLLHKLNTLPRAMRWLLWAAIGLVLYFAVVEPTLTLTSDIRSHADDLASGIQKVRALTSSDSEQGRILENGRRSFGEPYLPENPANRPEALHTAVDAILTKHGVVNRTKNERHVRVAGDEAIALLGPLAATTSVERLILDVTFEATPDTVTSILADLEQSKYVAAISRIEIRRQDLGRPGSSGSSSSAGSSGSKTVKAVLSPEAWVISGSAGAGGFR